MRQSLLFFLCLSVVGFATTFEEVDQYMQETNQIKIQKLNIEIKKEEKKLIEQQKSPTLDYAYGSSLTKEDSSSGMIQEKYYKSSSSLSFSYNLFDQKLNQEISLAKKDIELQQKEKDVLLKELRLSALNLYAQILILEKELLQNQRIYRLYKQIALNNKKLFESGEKGKIELLNSYIQASEIEELVQEIQKNLETKRADLDELTETSISYPLFPFVTASPLFASNLSELKLKDEEIKKKKEEFLYFEKTKFLPTVSLSGTYEYFTENESFTTSFANNQKEYQAGIYLKWNLYDGSKDKKQAQKANLELKKLYLEKDLLKAKLDKERNSLIEQLEFLNNDLVKKSKDAHKSLYDANELSKNDILTASVEEEKRSLKIYKREVQIKLEKKKLELGVY